MKRILILFSFLMIFLTSCRDSDSSLRIMTFNIRYDNPNDGENAWQHRKEMVVSMIRFHKADVIGLQESLKHQIDYMTTELPEYDWFGVGRDDGKISGEYTAIFYRKDRLDTLQTSTFWCSETPHSPGLGWDAACNRTVTWGKFLDKTTSNMFYLFNTHFDHQGETARIKSSILLLEKMKSISSDMATIVLGDFNSTPNSKPYKILTAESGEENNKKLYDTCFISKYNHHGPIGTFTGFDPSIVPDDPIDYIFAGIKCRILFHGTLSDTFDGHCPSDHMPVLAEIILK